MARFPSCLLPTSTGASDTSATPRENRPNGLRSAWRRDPRLRASGMRHPLSTSLVEKVSGSYQSVWGHGGLAGTPGSCPLRGDGCRGSGRGGGRAVAGAVGGVDGFVVADAEAQAVPEDFEPAVAELAQGGVVGVAGSGRVWLVPGTPA
jgi:hypothetical protein